VGHDTQQKQSFLLGVAQERSSVQLANYIDVEEIREWAPETFWGVVNQSYLSAAHGLDCQVA
jgi:hypothetical protein